MVYVDPVTGVEEEEISWGQDDETDDLDFDDGFGFDFNMPTQDRSGLKVLVESAIVSHRRLPALEVIFERAARLMTTSLRNLTGDTLEVVLDDISSTRFSDFQETAADNCVIAPILCEDLKNYSLITVDTDFVLTIVDLLLGGRREALASAHEDHKFTPIELALTQRVIENLCGELSEAFATVVSKPFLLEKIETHARFAAITQSNAVCMVAKFRVDMQGVSTKICVLIPYASLEPIQGKLLNEYSLENDSNKSFWQKALLNEVTASYFTLNIVLADVKTTIGAVAALKVGDVLPLHKTLEERVLVKVDNVSLAQATIGRSQENIVVRFETEINQSIFQSGPSVKPTHNVTLSDCEGVV